MDAFSRDLWRGAPAGLYREDGSGSAGGAAVARTPTMLLNEAPVDGAGVDKRRLDEAVACGAAALAAAQSEDGHWVFELEADATIPSEYIMLEHFLDTIDDALEQRIAGYIRSRQAEHGGWPLFHGGAFDISASVKAYLALKLAGDPVDAPHMQRAREAILAHGGARRSNVFTRIALALFGFVPWHAVPVMPVEIMLLPKWFPFHIDKISR